MRVFKMIAAVALASFALAPAHATTISTTFGAAGATVADSASLCAGSATCVVGVETFDNRTTSGLIAGFTTDFGTGGAITGAYSVANPAATSVAIGSADQYGGAGHAGAYPVLFNGGYTLRLSTAGVPGANYFGLWISALDAHNDLRFFDGASLVLDFTPALMSQYINLLPNASAYYGNPVTHEDAGEAFAFVNFFAQGGTFDRVEFSNAPGSGFESDNDTVAYRSGNAVFGNAIPEPATLSILAVGLFGVRLARRRA